ncbi:hypothetical protein CHS0354_018402 [Potamilus streckersoni]|uniref:UvrD-like helicase ATP-binding domain-containing protein n=1 Tax=Potamilus streckersoni TaxID=2493646 RepID=A0AAE0W996_9BIVA|nr:hypothetical protein CHS0354_018402 [Potamilus streckersoni]
MTQKFDITTARPVKGVHRIEANAGTGKTYTLEHLFKDWKPQEILMLTFSRRAVADLQRRISDRCLKEADTRSGTRSLRRPFEIYTFHGFFYRLLQLFPFASHINTGGEMITRPSLVTRPLAGMIMRDFCYESPDMTSFVMENYGSRVTNDYGAAGFLSKLYSMKHAHGAEAASEKEPDTALKQLIQGVSAHADAVRTVYKTLAEEAAVLTAFLADKNNINGKFFKAPSLAKVERTLSRMAAESSIFALYDTMNEQFPPEWVDKNIKVPFPFRFFNELQVLHPEHTRLKKQFMGVLSSYVSRHMADCAGDHITYDIIQKEGIALAVQEPARSYLKKTYRAVLIDEFQDTDSQQQRFLKELFYDGQHYTYLVGDAKQSIYSFRGANVQSAAGREDQIIRYSLSDNYRSGAFW